MNPRDMKLINLAFRVPSVGAAETLVDTTSGWRRTALHEVDGEAFLEASFAGVRVNFFENALYDQKQQSGGSGFLHASFQVPDLGEVLASEDWKKHLFWGPTVIKGGFGHRRIAFFEPIPGCRIELMEDLDD
ncbi:hypothetical protein ACSBOB_01785 [Mesorhizobium sp. ASY16-5R]|uniref:hypothetical protein n=1 Tax=Mesorhizobium sp. ASY16-5R TaxID=3445772 RepID=UPI003F9F5E64